MASILKKQAERFSADLAILANFDASVILTGSGGGGDLTEITDAIDQLQAAVAALETAVDALDTDYTQFKNDYAVTIAAIEERLDAIGGEEDIPLSIPEMIDILGDLA